VHVLSLTGLLGSFPIVLGMYLMRFPAARQHFSPGDLILFVACSIPFGCSEKFRTVETIRSIRRYKRRELSIPA
jgi:hypothetical protein